MMKITKQKTAGREKTMPKSNGLNVPCKSCRVPVDLIRAKRKAEMDGVRDILCPHCGHKMGSLN